MIIKKYLNKSRLSKALPFNQQQWFILASGLVLITASSLMVSKPVKIDAVDHFYELESYLAEDREKVETLYLQTEDTLSNLTQKISELEAQMMRVNALGEKLVGMADIDADEFQFDAAPGMGGPIGDLTGGAESILETIQTYASQLSIREQQLISLQKLLNQQFRKNETALTGSGKSITKGWISSYFGTRTDPFTGKKMFHSGVDIASKEGSPVKAVASGVVTWAGERGGYGNLIEINHGNGKATRYGHNKALNVKVGDVVRKGDVIAQVGRTGRATAPHVHFEVRENGRAVDPGQFFHDLKKKV